MSLVSISNSQLLFVFVVEPGMFRDLKSHIEMARDVRFLNDSQKMLCL